MNYLNRLKNNIRKGSHFVLRLLGRAPELRPARQLAAWSLSEMRSQPGDDRPETVLIWSIRDWSIHAQMEAVLGQVLRARGANVVVGTCGGGLEICDRANTWESPPMPCHSCSKYLMNSLRAHQFNVESLAANWGSESSWPELDMMSLEDLRQVEWDGLPLGKLVDIPVKWYLLGETLSQDPLAASTYRMFLRSARKIASSASLIIERVRPDQVVVLNGLLLFESVISAICKREEVSFITYERALMLDTFVFARDDMAGFYRVDNDWTYFSEIPLTANERAELWTHFSGRQHGDGVPDNYWQTVSKALELSTPAITRAVLFTNLVWDSAVIGQDVAFDSIIDWLVASVHEFGSRADSELIIRVHPAEVRLSGRESRERMEEALRKRIPRFPSNVHVISAEDTMSSYDLMETASFGLVYTSTTGLEMALRGKPVIVAGKTHYRNRGFTIDIETQQQFIAAINDQLDTKTRFCPDVELVERYAHLLFFKSSYSDFGVNEPIGGLCQIDPKKIIEGSKNPSNDLHRIVTTILGRENFHAEQR